MTEQETPPSELFGRVYQTNLDESTSHWCECPSFSKSNKQLKTAALRMASSARFSALLRLPAAYGQVSLTIHKLIDAAEVEIPSPVYQVVPASLLQSVTSAIPRFLNDPDKYMSGVYSFFEENSAFLPLFASQIFPSIVFHFLTSEFVGIGERFLTAAIHYRLDRSTACFVAAFFDSFPQFSSALWQRFDIISTGGAHSVFASFIISLKSAMVYLTPSHARIIRLLFRVDSDFAITFFASNYFHSRARLKYTHTQDDNELNILHELIDALEFSATHTKCATALMLRNTLERAENVREPELSYANDFSEPVIYCVTSGYEAQLLFDVLIHCGAIKRVLKKSYLRINDSKSVYVPGFMQYTSRDLFKVNCLIQDPIIFNNISEDAICESAVFNRTWCELDKLSQECCISPFKLVKSPPTPLIQNALSNLSVIHQPEFLNYAATKLHNKAVKSWEKFEKFMVMRYAEYLINQHTNSFVDSTSYYMSIAARDHVLERCVASGIISPGERIRVPSESSICLARQYKKIISSKFTAAMKFHEAYFVSTNQMISRVFNDNISQISNIDGSKSFVLFFTLHLIDEWSNEKDKELVKKLSIVAECIRLDLFITEEFEEIMDNKYLVALIKDLQLAQSSKIGVKMMIMSKIMHQIELICIKSGFAEKTPKICFDIISISGIDDFFLAFVWFGRMLNMYPKYITEIPSFQLWKSVKTIVFDEVSNIDSDMGRELLLAEICIPNV